MNGFREYRAWHLDLKKMLYPPHVFDSMTLCRDAEGNHVQIDVKLSDEPEPKKVYLDSHVTWDGRWYICGKYQNVIWMQYIGLKVGETDKKIFEGDLLKYNGDALPNYKGQIGVVKYEPDYGGYILEFKWSKDQHHVSLNCDVAFESEYVGDILQNPELF